MIAGTLTYETKIDTNNFQKGINDINNKVQSGGTKMKSILGALGIAKLVQSGINLITSSLDSAISRLDTLNNFPKVMSNLGISSKESSKEIERLSDGLQGLPTTLDAGALAVQRFTSKNGNIQKSTDMFLALNNAILAGGASTQIQESALEQLTQAYSKGKMDMMEWRSLQQAMPAQLKQVADTMGLTTDELGEMMRQGDNTAEVMDQFIDTIIDLNENGGKNIVAFKDQAKNATDGIKTNITNMKTAVARGVANIIDSLDKGLKKANLGGIGKTISSLGKTIENTLKNVAKWIGKIDFNKLMSTLKKLVPIITSAVVAFVAYEATLKAISVINIAKNILSAASALLGFTSSTELASGAMAIFNAVMSANPIGLVVASVAALTAGLILLNKYVKEHGDETQRTNQTIQEYDNSMKEANKSRQEYLDTNMNEIKNTQDLANELETLVDENGKVKAGYEDRANFIINELNSALGTEITMTDGVISNYKEVKKSIEDVIEAKRAQVLLEAEEKKYNEAMDQRAKLEKQYNENVAKTKEALKEKKAYEKELKDTYGLTNTQLNELIKTGEVRDKNLKLSMEEHAQLISTFTGLNSAYQVALDNENKIGQKYMDNELIIKDYEIAMQNMADGNYQAVLKMFQDTTNYQGKTDEETRKNYDNAIATQENYLKRLEENRSKFTDEEYNNLVSSGTAKLEELKKQQNEMTSTVEQGQKKTTEEWNKGLATQLSKLTGAKVEFKKTADGHIQAYIDGQKQGKPMSEKEAEKFGKDMAKEIDKAKSEANSAGTNLVYGTKDGINNRNAQNSAFSAISSFGSSLLSKLKASLKEKSPSKATREYGQYLIEGLEEGVEDEEQNAFKQIDNFGNEILDRMENAVNLEAGNMSFSGTAGSVNQILSANATFEGTIPMQIDLDGEKIYDNQQKISARKTLQYGGVKQ